MTVLGRALRTLRTALGRSAATANSDHVASIAPHVDERFYFATYPNARASGLDAAHHYVTEGAVRGHNPSPDFDTRFYLERYPDVARSGLNPLEHYLRFGRVEGRRTTPDARKMPSELDASLQAEAPEHDVIDRETERALMRIFDAGYYREHNPDVALSRATPVLHFLRHGLREGRMPNAYFDARWYLERNPDVQNAQLHPLLHFARYGGPEGRSPGPAFDAAWYVSEHPDAADSGFAPLEHFLHFGRSVGERPIRGYPLPAYLPVASPAQRAEPEAHPVTVVVPVYGGHDDVVRCIESVLASSCRTAFDLLVIEDASPDEATRAYVRGLEGRPCVRVLENETNLGFVRTVNRAFDETRGRDVVLLNSDTEVAGDWLDRLQAHAWSDSRVATVTPLSNAATICSYPDLAPTDQLPIGVSVAELDKACARVNRGRRVALPTGVGFCMYVRRDRLDEIGLFDAATFGKGYGEENDFCQRAIAAGYENVLAADVFVYHRGSVSFGSGTNEREAHAVTLLSKRYPDYVESVHRFVARDPANPWRHAVTAALLRANERPVVLLVSHGQGGGTDRHVLASARGEEANYLVLSPFGDQGLRLAAADPALCFDAKLDAEAARNVADLLRACGVERVHVHHVAGFPIDVRELVAELGVPFDFTAHDYYAICPRIRLIRGGRYCNEPGPEGCNACLKESPRSAANDIHIWRRQHAWLFADATSVICPSHDVRMRLERYAPPAKLVETPHPDGRVVTEGDVVAPPLGPDESLRVLVLGALSMEKGAGLLRDVAAVAARRGLPLAFHLVGYSCLWMDGKTPDNVIQTGPYDEADCQALIAKARPHVAWFPALWPETFSYTLSAALEAALPIVAPRLGAFTERLEDHAWRYLVTLELSPEELANLLMQVHDRVARDSRRAQVGGEFVKRRLSRDP